MEYGLEAAYELLAGPWAESASKFGSGSEVEAQFEPQLYQLDQYDQLKNPLNPFDQLDQFDHFDQFEAQSEPGSEFDLDVERYFAAPVPADPFNQPDPFAQPDPFTRSSRVTPPNRVPRPTPAAQPSPSTRGTPLDRHLLTNLPLYTCSNIARGLSVYVPELNCALSPGSPLLVANKEFYGRLWGHAVRMEIQRLDPRPGTRAHALLMKIREEAWTPSVRREEGCPPISRFPRLR